MSLNLNITIRAIFLKNPNHKSLEAAATSQCTSTPMEAKDIVALIKCTCSAFLLASGSLLISLSKKFNFKRTNLLKCKGSMFSKHKLTNNHSNVNLMTVLVVFSDIYSRVKILSGKSQTNQKCKQTKSVTSVQEVKVKSVKIFIMFRIVNITIKAVNSLVLISIDYNHLVLILKCKINIDLFKIMPKIKKLVFILISTTKGMSKGKKDNTENNNEAKKLSMEEEGMARVMRSLAMSLQNSYMVPKVSGPTQKTENKSKKAIKKNNSKIEKKKQVRRVVTLEQAELILANPGFKYKTTKFKLVVISEMRSMPIKELIDHLEIGLKINRGALAAFTHCKESSGYIGLINEDVFNSIRFHPLNRMILISLDTMKRVVDSVIKMIDIHLNNDLQQHNKPASIALRLLKVAIKERRYQKLSSVLTFSEAEKLELKIPTTENGIGAPQPDTKIEEQ